MNDGSWDDDEESSIEEERAAQKPARVGDLWAGSIPGPNGPVEVRVGWYYPEGWSQQQASQHRSSRAPLPEGVEFTELPEGWTPEYGRGRVDQLALQR